MSSTPLLFMSSTDQTPIIQPDQRPEPTPKPEPNPKPRGRKGGKAQKGPNKTARRGMGVEKLELERLKQEGFSPTTPKIMPHLPTNYSNNHFTNYSHYQHPISPLAGVPVHPYPFGHCRFLGQQPGPSAIRVVPELPSMPNQFPHNNASDVFTLKKKKVVGEEGEMTVGFGKGKEANSAEDYQQILPAAYNYGINYGVKNDYGGFNLHGNNDNNYGDQSQYLGANHGGYYPAYNSTRTCSEVVAIHKKTSGSNWMMEYGFFPNKSVQSNGEDQFRDYHINQNMEELDLKMGCSDSSSPSSSSSLTTASTITNTAGGAFNSSSLDLSLKLSYY